MVIFYEGEFSMDAIGAAIGNACCGKLDAGGCFCGTWIDYSLSSSISMTCLVEEEGF